ncbi:MAG: cytochrome c1 [Rhodobacteraceae bacterium]|nr:cytochrome c1 [Paracoccaceae bacterium]
MRAIAAACVSFTLASGPGLGAGGSGHVQDVDFSFEGPFGKFDQMQLQRGLKVYQEVCAACHGLRYVPFRTLGDAGGVGLNENEVKAIASLFDVFDPELDDFRPGKPVDNFPPNETQSAPDLSLMTKARAGFHGPYGTGINQLIRGIGGPEYLVSVLTAYTGEEREEAGTLLFENEAFPGGWLSMAPPLVDEMVEFADGSDNSAHAMAVDVAAFLTWAADPKMMARKQMGFIAVLLLVLLSGLLYLTNKAIWSPVKHRKSD